MQKCTANMKQLLKIYVSQKSSQLFLCNSWYGRVFKMSLIALFNQLWLHRAGCKICFYLQNPVFVLFFKYRWLMEIPYWEYIYVVIMNSPNNETRKGLLSWNQNALWNFFRNLVFLFHIRGNFRKRRSNW